MKPYRLRKNIVQAGQAVHSITALNDAPWRWAHGIQAGLAMGIPLGIFTFIGEQQLGLMASLGGFTVLYCADRKPQERLTVLPLIALGLIIASTIGVLCANNEWQTIAGLIIVTALFVVLTIGTQLGPPGPLMFILVAAVSSHLVAPSALGGAAVPAYLVPSLVGIGACLAYILVAVLYLFPFMKLQHETDEPLPPLRFKIRFDQLSGSMAIRIIACVAIASLISKPLEAYRSYWVIIAALAVLQGGNNDKRTTTIRAVQRLLGTLLGVIIFEVLTLLDPSGFEVVLLVTLLQFAIQVVVARNYTLALLFITPLALLTTTIGHPGNITMTVEGRIMDTFFGSVIAIVVFWIGDIILGFLPLKQTDDMPV